MRGRRHLGPVPLPGVRSDFGHVHARLPVPAVAQRPCDRRAGRRSANMSRTRRASSGFSNAFASASRWIARAGRRRRALDGRGRARRRGAPLHLRLPVPRQRLLRLRRGLSPELARRGRVSRAIVHPQSWPEDLDYSGKRVAVIGSGATAVTLVPALADKAAHVTMVQRSPSYIVARPSRDRIAGWLQRALPRRLRGPLVRWKNIAPDHLFLRTRAAEARPGRRLDQAPGRAPASAPAIPSSAISRHRYKPWDQRLCLVPDGDLFAAIAIGKVSIRTGAVERFTRRRAAAGDRRRGRGRYRRHRDRTEHEAARRNRARDRRRARRPARSCRSTRA